MQKIDKKNTQAKKIEILGFSGDINIKRISVTDNYSYKLFIKKHYQHNETFNTFSIMIKGELDQSTKVLKEVLKIYLPGIFHKFLELNILENEISIYNNQEH